ncbi:probable calcium-binding protein CML45 [Neltuma alba]|uniref:probable calcium-binding protein CML45 n=1 Tax=Neltuma alba TaxID=207710 RepID=UPI0010A35F9B|nr:probable calcium-binding protein CML45 [Prosopis alba]
MEKIIRNSNILQLFLSHGLFKTKGFLSFIFYHFQSLCNSWTSSSSSSRTDVKPSCRNQNDQSRPNKVRLSREDVMMVMVELGLISAESDGKRVGEKIGEEEVEALFEKEPSFEELRDAFEVFDENGDGFIEAKDLQRVLKCLGMQRDLEECGKMISAFDLNGDGLIDRSEFVKLMEQSFVT